MIFLTHDVRKFLAWLTHPFKAISRANKLIFEFFKRVYVID